MADNNFSSGLEALKEQWKNTKPRSLDSIANGVYQFVIRSAEFTSVPDSKDKDVKIPTVVMKFECISEGPEKGKKVTSWDRLNRPESMEFFKEKLRRLKISPDIDLELLEIELKNVIGVMVTANITNRAAARGDMVFTNIYIRSYDGKIE